MDSPLSPQQPACLAKARKTNPLAEMRKMQRVLFDDVMNLEIPAHVRAQCARAYEVLQERRDILRMRPAPKPVQVPVPPKAGSRRPIARQAETDTGEVAPSVQGQS